MNVKSFSLFLTLIFFLFHTRREKALLETSERNRLQALKSEQEIERQSLKRGKKSGSREN